MKRKVMSVVLMTCLASSVSFAAITGVTGDGQQIAPPANVTNAAVTNTIIEGFDELQGVTLGADSYSVDWGSLSKGQVVDSHMLFLNTEGTARTDGTATFTFDGDILAVMSNSSGSNEAATTGELGLPGTTYEAPFAARGLEGGDTYTVTGNELEIYMVVTEPGDWIRVVTAAPTVPAPSALLLAFTGLAGIRRVRRYFGS